MNAPITDPEVRALFAAAAIGRDAEEFMQSELGHVMLGIAEHEAAEALQKLKTVSWWRKHRILELQALIWRAESFKRWLVELSIEGQQAIQQLEQREDSE